MQSPTDSRQLAVTVKNDLQQVGRAYSVSQLLLEKLEYHLALDSSGDDADVGKGLRTAAATLKDIVGSMTALRAEARETIAAARSTAEPAQARAPQASSGPDAPALPALPASDS